MNKIIRAGAIAATAVLAVACTKSFEKFNTNPDAVQEVDVKSYITTMQMDAVIPCSDVGANAYQRACDLIGNGYAGYFAPCQQFGGGNYTLTYALDAMDYNNVPFEMAFTNVMPAWLNLRIAYENEQVDEDIFAVAEVIKVFCLQQTTDIYGPIPASHFGEDVNPYDSQEQVYMDLMEDLDAALYSPETIPNGTSLPIRRSCALLSAFATSFLLRPRLGPRRLLRQESWRLPLTVHGSSQPGPFR